MKAIYQNIEPKNQKKQYHGYHQFGYTNGGLIFRGVYRNDQPIGYHESHTNKKCAIFFII